MGKVLVVSTSRYTHGGISAVLKLYEQSEMWKQYHCFWLGTHRDGSSLRKVFFFLKGLVLYCFLLPFYNIVHIHFSLVNSARRKYIFFRLAKLAGKKIVLHLHCGSQIDDIWNKTYQTMFEQCDCGILLSESLKSKVENYIGKSQKLKVVFNPCPIINDPCGFTKKRYILFSGTLYDGKGYKDLLRAFAKVADIHPDWKIVFAGNGEVQQAHELAISLGISEQVQLLGWLGGSAKHKVFCEASALCLPSYAEGFPMAVLDAWAYGLPVLTTPVGGIPDVAIDGKNMLLFNPGDVEKMAALLDRLMTDSGLRERLSRESFIMAKSIFNVDTITNQVAGIYESLLDN